VEYFEKCGTLGKMGQTYKNATHLEKCGTIAKVQYTVKNVPYT